jgi:2-isopropylmalate synthase
MTEQKEKIFIFDTTLRDGEQAPGATMNVNEKCLIASELDAMGVDIIEAGFAVSSQGQEEAIFKISQFAKNSTICSLARAKQIDIEAAARALKPARHKRIHTFISTSPIHIKHKLNMTEEQVIEAIKFSVNLAKNHADEVEWSAEDATRTPQEFLFKAIETAIASGATIINVPDTVGYTTPDEYYELIKSIKNSVVNIDKAIISVHCHNDLGLAVANSLSALRAGARQIECTVNGIGERAGNASLEEVIMALKTRGDIMPYSNSVNTKKIMTLSKLVSSVTGFAVQKNKAIVGANAFAHESGIHQDGVLKNRQTYEIMSPEDIGLSLSTNLVLGKTSGRHAFKKKLEELGHSSIGDNRFEDVFNKFKDLCDQKKQVDDNDIIAILLGEESEAFGQDISVKSFSILSYGLGNCSTEVLFASKTKGELKVKTNGDGPVDCIFKAINSIFAEIDFGKNLNISAFIEKVVLQDYSVASIGTGTEAVARASIRLSLSDSLDKSPTSPTGVTASTFAQDQDTIQASAKAYIKALYKLANSIAKNQQDIKSGFGEV